MAEKARISDLKNYLGSQVQLDGWLYQSRSSGKVQFLIVRDGSGLCQCVVEKGRLSEELYEALEHLGAGVVFVCYRDGSGGAAKSGRL